MGAIGRSRTWGVALLALVVAGIGWLAASSGCGEKEPSGSASSSAPRTDAAGRDRGDTLVVAIQADPGLLNPVLEPLTLGQPIQAAIFPSLLGDTFEDCSVGHPPFAAESWSWSEDERRVTFRLREDLQWTDGRPVVADDVAFTFGLIADPAVASPRSSYVEKIERVEAPDPRTVVFVLREPYSRDVQFLHMGLPFLPAHAFRGKDPATLRGLPENRSPVCAGAFKVERWDEGVELVLARNETSALPGPALLDRVIFRILTDYSTRIAEFRREAVDFVENVDVHDLASLERETPHARLVRRGYRFLDYVAWNLRDPRFSDRRVRHALTLAIDRKALIRDLLTSDGVSIGREATGAIPPVLCKDFNDSIVPLPFDPGRARALLAEAGWNDADGDGTLDRDGKPFEFTLLYNTGNKRREGSAVRIVSMLGDLGIRVRTEVQDPQTVFERLRTHDFEAGLGGLSAQLVTDPTDLWHGGDRFQFNYSSYENPRVDEILDVARRETDLDRRRAHWRELEEIVYDDQPWTFLFWREEVVVIHVRFRGVGTNVVSSLHSLEEWWVPLAEQRYR